MRFAWVMAAMAALWVQPAGAVTIVLQRPTPEAGLHQKVSLTGLTGADTITATSTIPAVTFYFWENPVVLNGNEANDIYCTVMSGGPACHDGYTLVSTNYPVKAVASLDLSIIGSDVFIDWTMFAQNICSSIPVEQRTGDYRDRCGFAWNRATPPTLNIDVSGPSAQTFGYSVSNVEPPVSPVPEPATWALLILGIGFAGVAMRRHMPTVPLGTVVPYAF